MQRLVALVLLLLPALAGSATAARADPASDGISAAPWLHQLQQPYVGSSSLAAQQASSRSVVAVVDGVLRPLQHAADAATRGVSQVVGGVIRSSPAVPGTESRHSTRVMRRHFVTDTDPSAVCNDGTPGALRTVSALFCRTLTGDISAAADSFDCCLHA